MMLLPPPRHTPPAADWPAEPSVNRPGPALGWKLGAHSLSQDSRPAHPPPARLLLSRLVSNEEPRQLRLGSALLLLLLHRRPARLPIGPLGSEFRPVCSRPFASL